MDVNIIKGNHKLNANKLYSEKLKTFHSKSGIKDADSHHCYSITLEFNRN